MYIDTFRNTFAVDVLEYFNLVRVDPELNVKVSPQSSLGNDTDVDLEALEKVGTEVASEAGGPSSYNKTIGQFDGETASGYDPFLVTYQGPNDPEHPQNWPTSKKAVVIGGVMLLTCVTYMGSSIYTPGQEEIQKEFGVGHVVGTLNLSMYVLGYGLGPIIFSPLSEFAIFGRQQLYIITLFLFTMLQIGCALVHNIAGLVILRFLTGVLCSPSLSTGGATVGDVVPPQYVPAFIGMWSIGAVVAPVSGPLLGATMVVAENWRWIFWLLMWLSAVTLIILIFFFPETGEENILYRRCKRIRKATGDDRYYTFRARGEAKLTAKDVAIITLYRPFEIILKEPIVLALDVYIALAYGAFYLFFEAFPIVFSGVYHFTLIELGLAYMGFCIGACFAYAISLIFLSQYAARKAAKNTFTPETFLVLAMCVCWCMPLSLFLFGWAASVHWTLPMLAEIFFVICVFNLFQSIFSYLAMSYPKYLASVFAGNSICRAGFACAFPLFGQAMYNNLAIDGYPVGWGSSLLGFFTIGLSVLPFLLYKYGPYLRSKSKFTG
ncbi:probable Fluconazole resistance protein 1 [Zygosaccharomyces bailii ISA1307]|nr:probable Fluconazole resistance protein 1 [Zygosaccharomyces bailii ISA1307]